MQILKSKKDRMGTFNEYVPSNPHETVINLDKVADRARSYNNMPTSFKDEEGRSATEVYNKMLKDEVENLIDRYSPHWATDEYSNLAMKSSDGKYIAWNKEALDIFIHAGYPQVFNKFKKLIERKVLAWARVDASLLDTEQWKVEVDKALTEFAFQYHK
jgi:hypothetical protein